MVIYSGLFSVWKLKTSTLAGVGAKFKNWRAVRADRRLATTGAQNHDPDTANTKVRRILSEFPTIRESFFG